MLARARYFMRLRNDDFITEFCVAGACGPQKVVTQAPDGSEQEWPSAWEGDLLVFRAPDGYNGGPIGWMYDTRLQFGVRMPQHELERRALNMRLSVDCGG